MIGDETDQIVTNLFNPLLQKYQQGLEESMKETKSFLIVMNCYIINFIE